MEIRSIFAHYLHRVRNGRRFNASTEVKNERCRILLDTSILCYHRATRMLLTSLISLQVLTRVPVYPSLHLLPTVRVAEADAFRQRDVRIMRQKIMELSVRLNGKVMLVLFKGISQGTFRARYFVSYWHRILARLHEYPPEEVRTKI